MSENKFRVGDIVQGKLTGLKKEVINLLPIGDGGPMIRTKLLESGPHFKGAVSHGDEDIHVLVERTPLFKEGDRVRGKFTGKMMTIVQAPGPSSAVDPSYLVKYDEDRIVTNNKESSMEFVPSAPLGKFKIGDRAQSTMTDRNMTPLTEEPVWDGSEILVGSGIWLADEKDISYKDCCTDWLEWAVKGFPNSACLDKYQKELHRRASLPPDIAHKEVSDRIHKHTDRSLEFKRALNTKDGEIARLKAILLSIKNAATA